MSTGQRGPVQGHVVSWDEEAGWGVLASPEVPGEVWAHFSSIRLPDPDAFAALSPREPVLFTWEEADQDGDGEPNTPVCQCGKNTAPNPVKDGHQQEDHTRGRADRSRCAPEAGRLLCQPKQRSKMTKIPIKIEITAEQSRDHCMDKVEKRRYTDNHRENACREARANNLRPRHRRNRDDEEHERELCRRAPFDG